MGCKFTIFHNYNASELSHVMDITLGISNQVKQENISFYGDAHARILNQYMGKTQTDLRINPLFIQIDSSIDVKTLLKGKSYTRGKAGIQNELCHYQLMTSN